MATVSCPLWCGERWVLAQMKTADSIIGIGKIIPSTNWGEDAHHIQAAALAAELHREGPFSRFMEPDL